MRGFIVRLWLAACLIAAGFAPAQADSWAMPAAEVYTSVNGAYRFTVEPAPIRSQLDYFREEVAASESGTKVDRPTPIGLLERRDGDGWTPVWAKPLVNSVAPVDALVSDDGQHIVTFDNWHSTGFGESVIVLYDGQGGVVRSMALTEILPEVYFDALPRSVSSLQWREGARFSEDGKLLELDVLFPAEGGKEPEEAPVRFAVSLADGGASPARADRFDMALAAGERIARLRSAADKAHLSYLTQPLAAPVDPDGDWYGYLREAFFRLTPDYLDSPFADITVLFAPDNDRYRESVGWLEEGFSGLVDLPGAAAVASPRSQDGLIQALERATRSVKHGKLRESTIYVSVDAAYRPKAEALIAATGARFVWLDPASTIAQRPERMPGSAEEKTADEERSRRQREEMDSLLDDLGG